MPSTLTERDIDSRRRAYDMVRFKTPQNSTFGSSALPFRYPISGDHLYINRINGPGSIQVRLNSKPNVWINVSEGMTLTRVYDQIYVRDAAVYNPGITEMEAYASWGALITRGYKSHGTRGAPYGCHGLTAITTAHSFSSGNGAIGLPTGTLFSTFSDDGGFIIIKNTDAANTLYFGMAIPAVVPANVQDGYPLSPGESCGFDVAGKITISPDAALTSAPGELCFWTLAGTCAFSLLISSGSKNRSDSDFGAISNVSFRPISLED